MSTFREYQTGFTLGQQQQNQRKLQTARADASALFDSGDYSGSESTLMKAGDMEGASAFAEAGARRKTTQRLDAYGNAMKTGGYGAVRGAAVEQGDIGMAADMDKVIASMGEQEREAAGLRAQFFGQAAYGLAQIKDPAQRQAAFQQILATSGKAMGVTPEQAASFDVTNDEALKSVFMSSMKLADQIKMDQDGGYTLSPGQERRDKNNKVVATGPAKTPGSGIQLDFGEDGALSGLSIGGTGTKGKEPSVIRGPDGQPVVSPGSQQLASNKDWKAIQDFEASNKLVTEEIDRALGAVSGSSTGAMAWTADIPVIGGSTDAGRLKNLVGTIKANIGFDKLQSMRENSPTGGALGSITEKEIAFLQAVFGSLETSQREEDVRYNLKRIKDFVQGRGERLRNAFAQDYPSLAEFAGFRKDAVQQGAGYEKMSFEDLEKRRAELRAKAGKQ